MMKRIITLSKTESAIMLTNARFMNHIIPYRACSNTTVQKCKSVSPKCRNFDLSTENDFNEMTKKEDHKLVEQMIWETEYELTRLEIEKKMTGKAQPDIYWLQEDLKELHSQRDEIIYGNLSKVYI
jgi:hypothetical protein